MDNHVTVLGGGTAGWLTAYYLIKKLNYSNVTVIDSSEIGILGAGEGSTPILKKVYIDQLGLDEKEFTSKVNGTKKYGINFVGWNEDPTYEFIHGFELNGYPGYNSYAYHFDAVLFAKFLKEKTLELGGKHLDKVVKDFTLENSKIKKVIFNDGTDLETSFIFDCSGYNRMIAGGVYNSEWVSYEDQLLVDRALPFSFSTDIASKFANTSAIASEAGWIWEIPLQNRYGCGYVFSSTHATEEDIKKEILLKYSDKELSFGKLIQFKSGYYSKVANHNSVAIGLSTGFLEPLEATSIMTTVQQLIALPTDLFNSNFQEEHNTVVKSLYDQSMLFIRHHYNFSRNDTKFWKDYRELELPDTLIRVYSTVMEIDDNVKEILNPARGLLAFKKNNYQLILLQNFAKKELI